MGKRIVHKPKVSGIEVALWTGAVVLGLLAAHLSQSLYSSLVAAAALVMFVLALARAARKPKNKDVSDPRRVE